MEGTPAVKPVVTEATVFFKSNNLLVALCPKRLLHTYDITNKEALKSLKAGDQVVVQYISGMEPKVLSVTPIKVFGNDFESSYEESVDV